MLEKFNRLDGELFLWMNSHHNPWLDQVMWYFSKMQFWFPVYAALLFFLYKRYSLRQFGIALLFVAVLLFITDFLAVHMVKNTVMRIRPSHNSEFAGKLHHVRDAMGNFYKGGLYGFFSNHASNHFGIAMFFLQVMRPMKSWHVWLLFSWVSVISYSRIYLGVHYPGDILAGAVYGMIAGWLMGFFCKNTLSKMR